MEPSNFLWGGGGDCCIYEHYASHPSPLKFVSLRMWYTHSNCMELDYFGIIQSKYRIKLDFKTWTFRLANSQCCHWTKLMKGTIIPCGWQLHSCIGPFPTTNMEKQIGLCGWQALGSCKYIAPMSWRMNRAQEKRTKAPTDNCIGLSNNNCCHSCEWVGPIPIWKSDEYCSFLDRISAF